MRRTLFRAIFRRGGACPAQGRPRVVLTIILIGLALLVLAATARATPVAAQGGGDSPLPPGVTFDDVNQIARKMYCDVCEGVPLDECESIACRQWRDEIARQLGEGRTETEIIDYFVARYGADVAAMPRGRSDRFLVFAIPISLALLLGIVGAFQVRQLRQRGQQAGQGARRTAGRLRTRPVPDDIDPALLERLARELEDFEA